MKGIKLNITKRKLPHWTIENAIYFVTYTLKEGVLSDHEKQIIFDHILSGHTIYYDLLTFTVMSNHVHLIFNLFEGLELSRVMKGIKGVSSHLINESRGSTGNNWLDESFDRIIRNKEELTNAIEYIFDNPVNVGMVKNGEEYPFYFFNENWNHE